jgi:hypothetical protein
MKTLRFVSFLCILGFCLLSCLDSYQPPKSSDNASYLVVDGNIDRTTNQILVKLSMAIPLDATVSFPSVDDAVVEVEDQNGFSTYVPLIEPGVYKANRTFNSSFQYRLKVKLANDNEYTSEPINILKTADIDSVTYRTFSDRLEVYINTHDFSEGKKYYYYTYEETYEYNSPFSSGWMFEGTAIVPRAPNMDIYTCWLTQPSSDINLASTENLSENLVTNKIVHSIPRGDRRLWKKYSIEVKQTALSKEAYDYWRQIENISESLGGLFDPVPYAVKGNITSINSSQEPVLGYFSASEVKTKRIVIPNRDLPRGFSGVIQTSCTEDYVTAGNVSSIQNRNILLTRAEYMAIFIVGYYYSTPACVDCRLEGGTNIQPPFMN